MVMKKAVIFDLDGTLSDSIQSIKYCGDAAVAPFGYGPFSIEQYKYFVGDGAANLVKRMLVEAGDTDLIHFEEAFVRYRELFREGCMYKVKPYDGILELLATLKEKGVAIAVLSNKPHDKTNEMTRHFFGDLPFSVINGGRPGVKLKPDAGAIEEILDIVGADKAHTFYVGDSDVDMFTANNAGVFACAACWGFRPVDELRAAGADALCMTPYDAIACAKTFFEGK